MENRKGEPVREGEGLKQWFGLWKRLIRQNWKEAGGSYKERENATDGLQR